MHHLCTFGNQKNTSSDELIDFRFRGDFRRKVTVKGGSTINTSILCSYRISTSPEPVETSTSGPPPRTVPFNSCRPNEPCTVIGRSEGIEPELLCTFRLNPLPEPIASRMDPEPVCKFHGPAT